MEAKLVFSAHKNPDELTWLAQRTESSLGLCIAKKKINKFLLQVKFHLTTFL